MSTHQIEKPNNPSTSPHLDEQVKQALHQVYRYLMERAWLRQSAQSNGDNADSAGTPPVQAPTLESGLGHKDEEKAPR